MFVMSSLASCILLGLVAAAAASMPATPDRGAVASNLDAPLCKTVSSLQVDVYAHVVADQTTHFLSLDAIESHVRIMGIMFASAQISFRLVHVHYQTDPDWASGNDLLNMKYDSSEGDGRALNLYFIDHLGGQAAECSVPDVLETDKFRHKLDGCVVVSSAIFNNSFTPQNRQVLRELGSWFGLKEAFRGKCGESEGWCEAKIIATRGGHVHEAWQLYRASYVAATEPVLRPIEPIWPEAGDALLPFYPRPSSRTLALTRCSPDRFGRLRETGENYCSTPLYCEHVEWRLAGRAFSLENLRACLNARARRPARQG